ncbi:histidinol-phosphate transaminase [Nodosilinea sp. E11]|uniref:histidinol-phosphate transaminase n=1 Tax=Nodosilinea sp. E11 TaxID=3037479 RepID=UPI002934CEF2|nr:histidinol-phosphate transaminase [Nodosilinea sp. E11]WOD39538.1 histidinol-phosphate transaminase [Nodosilinea sp. E11]
MSYVRPNIAAMAGYVPGEQPRPGSGILKLNSNENPYPPSPQVIEALRQVEPELLRRYPDPFARQFCQAIAEVLDVPADWIIVGNGSDDLLNLLVRACADDVARSIVYPTPTYVLYRTLAAVQPATVVEVPYPDDFQFPLKELVAAQGAITVIASPNSPSGHGVALADLRALAQQASGLVVVDEAYVDFAEGSALSLVQEFDNAMVLRTLSKGYGLAGLRLGFGIANPALLADLFKVKDSYNVDALAIALGTAAIRDQAYKNACVSQIKASRATLTQSLRQLGFKVLESHGNFVLATPPQGNAEQLYLALKKQGILVRYFKQPRLDDKLRISVGTEEQNHALIAALTHLKNC